MTDKAPKRRPFHEVVVDVINRASTMNEMRLLEELLMEVQIPKGHDAIITAWQDKEGRIGWNLEPLVADLLLQKREAEEKAAKKEQAEKATEKTAYEESLLG